jgi:PAS domain S-box-containing protein
MPRRASIYKGSEYSLDELKILLRKQTAELQKEIRLRKRTAAKLEQSQKALKISEEKFRNSVGTSPLGVRIFTPDDETLYANKSLLNICGCTTIDELRTTPLTERYTSQSYAEYLVRRERRRLGLPVSDPFEVSMAGKNGKITDLRAFRREVVWEGRIAYQTIYEDITIEKRAKEMMTALSHRLIEVQENERRNLARELHDQIGQLLNVVNLSLQRAVKPTETNASALVNEAQTQIKELLDRVNNMSFALRPIMLDDLGLLDALIWYLRSYRNSTGVRVDFKHFGLDRIIDPQITTTVYRIVQECLTNVARHARVKVASLRVWIDQSTIGMEVEDKGVGFDTSNMSAVSSVGISGMRERAALVGGNLAVVSVPGSVTTVTAKIPLLGEDGNVEEEA